MERFKRKNIWFVVIIGAIIITIFTNEIGYERLMSLLDNSNKLLVILAVLFNLLNLVAFAKTWQFLSPARVSLYKLFKFYMAGTFINNITPTFGTGGEPVKAMLLGKETGTSKSECFASVVSQRMLNMFPFLTFGSIGIVFLFSNPDIGLEAWEIIALVFSTGIGFLAFGLIVYFYVRKDRLSNFVHSTIRFLAPFIGFVKKGFDHLAYSDAVEKSIDSFHGGLMDIHKNKYGLFKATVYSFIGWFFDILSIYAVFLALGAESHIQIGVLILAYTLSMMSGWLPLFMPGGLGIVDGTMAVLFIYGGVPVEIAMLATLLYRLASYWSNTVIGGYYMWSSLKA